MKHNSFPNAPAIIAFGPSHSGWGSWEWVGEELLRSFEADFNVLSFEGTDIPECDVAVLVKHTLPQHVIAEASKRCKLIYFPIDCYGSSGVIDQDALSFRKYGRIIVHCHRLEKYFSSYAPVSFLHHHLKYVSDDLQSYRHDGPVLWVGVRSNIPYLADWWRYARLDFETVLLSNFEDASRLPSLAELGFPPDAKIQLEMWTTVSHKNWLQKARAAIDIKGHDFRQKHKPYAKAIDFVASGIPLAMNRDSSSSEYFRNLGLDIPDPCETDRWFSKDYHSQTAVVGAKLRQTHSLESIKEQLQTILDEVISEPLPK